eukprot:CAMPEP_0197465814 /NCGR_PEP_ID=MMETSP1175-20131217/64733_1 /TAXON_ID=1003142 /ORGANISM="Triceratium dubium, Strain CCMP147" /LENGTH=330 /DNA_ID=CAMNT_0043001837 /DNA_START=68 /DNA_END=1060 /DNA_ORIENTATION=-
MASLSISDAPLHSSSRKGGAYSGIHPSGSIRISPTNSTGTGSSSSSGGGGAEIDGIDPERADILASHSHDDVMLHEEDDEGVVLTDDFGGSPHKERKGSSASVWKTYLCKYRYVFAGVLILVTASLVAGIAIGASRNNRSAGQAAGAAATTQTDGADKGGYDLDLNVPTPPDEPADSAQPQHDDHGALNPQDGAGAAPVDVTAQGSGGRGDSNSGSQSGRGNTGDSADDTRTKNKKTGGFKPSTGTGGNEATASTGGNEARDKTKVGGAVGGGAGGQKSLSYSQRNRRALLGNLHKIKAAKDNRNSAAKNNQRHHQQHVQKKWRGGTLEG